MRSRVRISLQNGEVKFAAGWASQAAKEVEKAKAEDRLAIFERDSVPTGQMFHIDPVQVASIEDDQ